MSPYGVDQAELDAMRTARRESLAARDPAEVRLGKVERHFKNKQRTTSRKAARSLNMRLADVRQMVARLIECGKLERDGDLWEKGTTQDRFAAAYRWTG